MEKQTNLYLITTSGAGDFYVTGSDPTEEQNKLSNKLEANPNVYTFDQKVVNIKLLAEEWSPKKHLERFVN